MEIYVNSEELCVDCRQTYKRKILTIAHVTDSLCSECLSKVRDTVNGILSLTGFTTEVEELALDSDAGFNME